MEIILCPPVEKPQITCINTENFGSPKGSIGRHGHLISGIIVHCIDADMAQMDSLACADLKLKKYKSEHGSPHFFVSKEGNIHQYVDEEDIAWSFPSQLVGIPNLSLFDWQLVRDNPNTPIDYYTLSIGVEKDLFTRLNDCDCRGLNETTAYSNLVQLIAWLAQEYNIPKNINHIEFHQNIDAEAELECGDCLNALCVVCDVSSYCQPCKHPSKTEFKLGTLKYVYGENIYGCLVKMEVSQLAALLRTL